MNRKLPERVARHIRYLRWQHDEMDVSALAKQASFDFQAEVSEATVERVLMEARMSVPPNDVAA